MWPKKSAYLKVTEIGLCFLLAGLSFSLFYLSFQFNIKTHLNLILVYGIRQGSRLFFVSHCDPVVPTPFVEKTFLSPLNFTDNNAVFLNLKIQFLGPLATFQVLELRAALDTG